MLSAMDVQSGFPGKDDIVGWGVYRSDPWHFAGIFEHKSQADNRAKELGAGYVVAWGRNAIGSDDFLVERLPNA